jgi:crossover junction endodeoxyribonuclease RuvC
MSNIVRILGIDPGFDRTGFGVIDTRGSDAIWVAHGCIQTRAGDDFAERLKVVRNELKKLVDLHQPHCVAVEELFFQTNAKTAIKVGMARGVIVLTLSDAGLPIVELTPNQVKQGIAGWGAADKKQVQFMVQRVLKLKDVPKPDDAADALAIAIVGGMLYRRERLA